MTYLGLDIGTSGVKAILIDRKGAPIGEATAKSVEPTRPHPGVESAKLNFAVGPFASMLDRARDVIKRAIG